MAHAVSKQLLLQSYSIIFILQLRMVDSKNLCSEALVTREKNLAGTFCSDLHTTTPGTAVGETRARKTER